MKVDLHIHSNFSDGRYSPSAIVEYAAYNNLAVISLTDHDTMSGVQEARFATKNRETLKFLAGVEVSTCLESDELHILGYGIDEHHPAMQRLLINVQQRRKKRVGRILKRLQYGGIQVSLEDIKNGYFTESLGRMHIARLLMKRGYVRTIREAFDRYLSYESHPLTPKDFISSQQAIEVILEAGGIPVFAHPTIGLFDRHIDALVAFGLRGVEVFKISRPAIEEFYLETVVKDKHLFLTGGSDWHGYNQTQHLGRFYVDSTRIQPFLEAVNLE